MQLYTLVQLLNKCWKHTEPERFLLGNHEEVFRQLTGGHVYHIPPNTTHFEVVNSNYASITLNILPYNRLYSCDRVTLIDCLVNYAQSIGVYDDT